MNGQTLGDRPLVTVVTPSFNQGRFIRETIDSVLNQDYPNVEYIVVDGDSTDDTPAIVRPYLNRLTFISEPDFGQSHAINKGFAMARGSIVAWLNSDDIYMPGAISAAVDAFQWHRNAAVVYGEGYQIDEEGNIKQCFPYTQHFDRWKLVNASDYILQQATFFRKSALEAVGPLREDLNYVMDWELLIRLAKRFEFVRLENFLGALREYEAAKTSTGGVARAFEILRMLRLHCDYIVPPGFMIYAGVPFAQRWTARIDTWPKQLGLVKTYALKGVSRVCFGLLNRAMRYSQAWHRDGWMERSARVMLSEGNGEAAIHGQIPGNVPTLTKQRITVSYRGRQLARREFGPGKFEIRVIVPAQKHAGCPVLDIQASEVFVLSKLGMSSDQRELSCKLIDVGWSRPNALSEGLS